MTLGPYRRCGPESYWFVLRSAADPPTAGDRATSTAMFNIVNDRIKANGRAMLRVDRAGTVTIRGERGAKWRMIGARSKLATVVIATGSDTP